MMNALEGHLSLPTLVGFDIAFSTTTLLALGKVTYEKSYRGPIFQSAESLCDQFGGQRYQSHQGDALLFQFVTGVGATQFAVALQQEVVTQNAARDAGQTQLAIRIAIHTAVEEMMADEHGDYGFHRDMAFLARILSDARPNQILASESTNRSAFPEQWRCWASRNAAEFGEQDYYELLWQGDSIAEPGLPLNLGIEPIGWEEHNYRAKIVLPLVEAKTRLMLLHATFGTGKTVLADYATKLIRSNRARFHKDGAYFIRLADIREPNQIWRAIATELGKPDFQENAIVHYISQHRLHLTLDNFEQFLAPDSRDEAIKILKALQVATGVTLLITSRELLNIGETVVHVERFDLKEAVALFNQCGNEKRLKRAGASAPSRIENICTLLECHPLAIKLAASRTVMCSLDEIKDGVLQCLDEGDFSDADELGYESQSDDYRKTYATIQWSYNLLSPSAQALLRRIAVFRTGHRDAILAVCSDSTFSSRQLRPDLNRLINHCLIEPVEHARSEHPRFRQHEIIRSFCKEKLRGDPTEDEMTRQRCFDYFYNFALGLPTQIHTESQIELLGEVDDDYNNLLSALELGTHQKNYLQIAHIHTGLGWYWYKRGLMNDGYQRVQWLRECFEQHCLPDRTEDIETYERTYAELLITFSLMTYRVSGNTSDFHEALKKSSEIWRKYQCQELLVNCLNDLALACFESAQPAEIEKGQKYSTECLALCQTMHYQFGEMRAYGNLARAAMYRNDFVEAESLGNKMLRMAEEQGDTWNQGVALYHLVISTLLQGNFGASQTHMTRGITIYERLNTDWVAPLLLIGFAQLAIAQRNPYVASVLVQMAQSIASLISLPLLPVEQGILQRVLHASQQSGLEAPNENIAELIKTLTIGCTPPFAQFWIGNGWQPPTLTEAVAEYTKTKQDA